MKKKLQIFISSTFADLQAERQSAVEAILRAGHIPAGMELFSAGNESQLEIIKRWIDESDVYMLVLGGRYGSIDKQSGLSYTEVEYRYALEKNKPVFAIVVSDNLLQAKVKEHGTTVLERKQIEKYDAFKELVLSKVCRFFDNDNEIKISVFESILDIQSRFDLKGWIRYEDMPDVSSLLNQLSSLQDEVNKLNKELTSKNSKVSKSLFGSFKYEEVLQLLRGKSVTVPKTVSKQDKDYVMSYLDVLISNSGVFNTGIDNQVSSGDANHLLYKVASDMIAFGLIEQKIEKRGQNNVYVLRTSDDGKRFIAETNLILHQAKQKTAQSKKEKQAQAEKEK
ncbi:hypothetical protein GCM10027594_07450 [Hymenobacter agri]